MLCFVVWQQRRHPHRLQKVSAKKNMSRHSSFRCQSLGQGVVSHSQIIYIFGRFQSPAPFLRTWLSLWPPLFTDTSTIPTFRYFRNAAGFFKRQPCLPSRLPCVGLLSKSGCCADRGGWRSNLLAGQEMKLPAFYWDAGGITWHRQRCEAYRKNK